MPYSRSELVDLRRISQQQPHELLHKLRLPDELRRHQPVQYSRQQLLSIRSSTNTSDLSNSTVRNLLPEQLRRESDVTKTDVAAKTVLMYSSKTLRAYRDSVKTQQDPELSHKQRLELPEELRRTNRFRCESDCANEQQHEIKQILKYTRSQLVQLRNAGANDAVKKSAQKSAPEIFRRSLGR